MSPDAVTFIVGAVCLIVGWYAHILWDEFLDWLEDATGAAGGALWDLLAIVGIVALCGLGAWIWLG